MRANFIWLFYDSDGVYDYSITIDRPDHYKKTGTLYCLVVEKKTREKKAASNRVSIRSSRQIPPVNGYRAFINRD